MMEKFDINDKILQRLDIVILLMLESMSSDNPSIKRKIERLLDFGLSNTEISKMVGKPSNYIGAISSAKRKRCGKSKVSK